MDKCSYERVFEWPLSQSAAIQFTYERGSNFVSVNIRHHPGSIVSFVVNFEVALEDQVRIHLYQVI